MNTDKGRRNWLPFGMMLFMAAGLAGLAYAQTMVGQSHQGHTAMAASSQGSDADLQRYYETSPLQVPGASITLKNSKDGVVIRVSSKDRQTAQTIRQQAKAFIMEKNKIDNETTTCPVMGTSLKKGEAYNTAVYEGKIYYFCCGACKPDFLKNPENYVKH